jgi:vacuolar-type H+-ATPase subunit F/Vma7
MGEDLCLGFSLAGITVFPCREGKDFRETLRAAVDSGEFAIIVVEEEYMDGLDAEARKAFLRRARPLLLPIRGSLVWRDTEEISEDELIRRLIKQAVGYQLNIRF